jgi:hypothetical protein
MGKRKNFRKALKGLINTHSMENGSDTPDYVLARYMDDCLKVFDRAVNRREWSRNTTQSTLSPGTIMITGRYGTPIEIGNTGTITNRTVAPLTVGDGVSPLTVGP